MKNTALLVVLFLLSTFTLTLPSATAAFVLDTDGNPVENKGKYYILPAPSEQRGGGIEAAVTGNETCPLTVVLSPIKSSKGKPILISSPTFVRFISEERMLKFEFNGVPTCASSPLWSVVKGASSPSEEEEKAAVKLSGYYENAVKGWFEIRKVSDGVYKLGFCARDADTCESIGVNVDEFGYRHLVLTEDHPVQVVFEKINTFDE